MAYRAVIVSGLLWIAGPVWAGEGWCERLGEMARATVELREARVPMAVCLQHVADTGAPGAIQAALRAQCYSAYEAGETPEQARVRAIRICREAAAQVERDVQQLANPSVQGRGW